jgi:long-chain acyl-CoA synthetase
VTSEGSPWLAAYPAGVPTDFEFPQVPLTRLLDDAAGSFPTCVAVSYAGRTITYRELVDDVDRFAGSLRRLGVQAGDRVAIVLPNCPQFVVALFAAMRIGAMAVPCNPLSTAAELQDELGMVTPTALVCLDRSVATLRDALPDLPSERVVVASLLDYYPASTRLSLRSPMPKARRRRARLTAPVPAGMPTFRALLRSGQPVRQVQVDAAHDVAVLQLTGGTTGSPKAAMLTHANLVANAYQTRLWIPDATAGRETTLSVLPLFHVFGLTMCVLTTVLLAGRLVLLPRFDLELVFDAIDDERPTLFPGVPPIYQAIVDAPDVRRHDLSSIRVCISGAMKLPVATQDRFERITGARLVEGYGTTETSPATHCNPVAGAGKRGTVGVPLPRTEARIVDPTDPMKVLGAGADGELAVRGPQVFRGYWPDDVEPAADSDVDPAVDSDGWFLTGDLARMDDDGYFTIVDRKKDVIIAGGFNIYPGEVEAVIATVAGVADCCVIGLPDRYRGETVKAYVVPEAGVAVTEQQVVDACAQQLSAYKVPKLVEMRDTLPRSAVGKALRRELLAEEKAKGATGD